MRRLERLYAITEEIRRHEPAAVSAAWLADRFDVSRRTIERDLSALGSAGVPIRATRGRRGGYRVDPGTTWTPLALNPAEVTALLLALAVAPGVPYGYAARSAAGKLADALPPATRAEVDLLRSRLRVVAPASAPVDSQVRAAVEDAVRLRRVVGLSFTDRAGLRTVRDVEPVGFYGSVDGWSLVGWCRLRQAGRMFRLDRIDAASVTKEEAPTRNIDETLGWVPEMPSPLPLWTDR